MTRKFIRKPITNFFIKPDLQIRLIKKIVLAVLLATGVVAATLILTYFIKNKSIVFYQVTLESGGKIGNRESIISIIFPTLIISSIVNIFIAIGIGLYASRKYAVPIFKLERWVHLLQKGELNAQLQFREKAELGELCDSCNQFSDNLRKKFEDIEGHVLALHELSKNIKNENLDIHLKNIQETIDTMALNYDAIEIHTSYLKRVDLPKIPDEEDEE